MRPGYHKNSVTRSHFCTQRFCRAIALLYQEFSEAIALIYAYLTNSCYAVKNFYLFQLLWHIVA
ncbi:hypothetical protein QUB10_25850 [Microcoleus sp. B5-D4]|uniref:hypothetical protein n=1 Tax=unclassified Microcoleus TaxID=2642155 RepID=UPI002FD36543